MQPEQQNDEVVNTAPEKTFEAGVVNTTGGNSSDIFGQTHPPKANDLVTCKNCGRVVQAGVFAPHLEKCLGKGRRRKE